MGPLLRLRPPRLQEQVEALTKERDHLINRVSDKANEKIREFRRAEAAEAERDRLRAALERILNAAGCGVDLYNDASGREAIKAGRAALQKEPQP